LPNIFQVDKLSALGSTIEYVKQLEEKLKALEEQSARTTSTFFGNKCRVVPAEKNDDLLDSADIATSAGGSNSNPTVEAIVYADTVLLKICCKDKRGVLVVVLSELEKRGLSILDTSVLPFTDSCLNITIIAKARLPLSPSFRLPQGNKQCLLRHTTATLRHYVVFNCRIVVLIWHDKKFELFFFLFCAGRRRVFEYR
jgi:hypothetical protein